MSKNTRITKEKSKYLASLSYFSENKKNLNLFNLDNLLSYNLLYEDSLKKDIIIYSYIFTYTIK
jgi:hypothetical protein